MAFHQPNDRHTRSDPRAFVKPELYGNLLPQCHEIRLLQLHPSYDPSSGIECTLETYFLSIAPPYKALSYAWNEDNQSVLRKDEEASGRDVQINLRSIHHFDTFEQTVIVSKSLAHALRRLRNPYVPVLLWLDSLCINQMDDDERTSQVGMMGMIYQSAAEVIIWLGERHIEDEMGEWLQGIYQRTVVYSDWNDDAESQSLVETYIDSYEELRAGKPGPMHQKRDVYGAFCLIWLLSRYQTANTIPFYHGKSFTDRFRMDWATQVSEGLRAIMRRNWWHRAWVVQETVLARKATVVYSTLSAPWLMFANAATFYLQEQLVEDIDQRQLIQGLGSVFTGQQYRRTGDALSDFCGTVLSIENTRKEWALQKPVQLLTLLRRFRSRLATDHRDKVFSLLGLVDRWMTIPLNIDYKMTKEALYASSACQIVAEGQSLSILCDINQSVEQLETTGRVRSQPSWVPDWSTVSADDGLELERLSKHEHYSAGHAPGHAYLHANSILETKGYVVGRIEQVAPNVPQDAIERLRQAILAWQSWWLQETASGLGTRRSSTFIATVCGGLLYNPQVDATLAGRSNSYTKAEPEKFEKAYQAWATDSTTKRYRKTAIFADSVTNTYVESGLTTQLKNSFYYSVRAATVARRFFTFHRHSSGLGFPRPTDIGVGPPHVDVGDIIYIPYGSRVPLIIRPQPLAQEIKPGSSTTQPESQVHSHEKRTLIGPNHNTSVTCNEQHPLHDLIGDAYVDGYMDCESVQRKQLEVATIYLG